MTIKECYTNFGENFEDVLSRMMSEERVVKYVKKFCTAFNLDTLKKAVCDKDVKTVFTESHTLKGMCLNLGFTKLTEASSRLCESVRGGALTEPLEPMLESVECEYQNIVKALELLDS